MTKNARELLRDTLKPLLPAAWQIVPSTRATDAVKTTVVQLRQLDIRRLPQAGRKVLETDFQVVITAPQEGTQAAEDRLDTDVLELLIAITKAGIKWGEAVKVIADKKLGYQITLSTIATLKE